MNQLHEAVQDVIDHWGELPPHTFSMERPWVQRVDRLRAALAEDLRVSVADDEIRAKAGEKAKFDEQMKRICAEVDRDYWKRVAEWLAEKLRGE